MTITWFKTSPDAGDPTCLCSWCEQLITEDDAPVLRLYDQDAGTEARFHLACAGPALRLPIGLAAKEATDE